MCQRRKSFGPLGDYWRLKYGTANNGNAGTLIAFRVGVTNAAILAKQFGADVPQPRDLGLGKYEMYVRLMIDGQPSKPLSARSLPPPVPIPQGV